MKYSYYSYTRQGSERVDSRLELLIPVDGGKVARAVIKVLPPEMAASVSMERFRREIMLAARLQHPHIVPLLSAGETDGVPYLTMPFVDGESLRARLSRGGELDDNQGYARSG